MFDSVINLVDKYYDEIIVIQFGFLVIISTLLLWLWFYNRRKYHHLKHYIPANVVKNYLDSIIQNSNALKSSLFRGGGVELNGVPSVMPLGNLTGGDSIGINGAPSTALMEEVNQKKAIIASLESQLFSSQTTQRELEGKLQSLQQQLPAAENKIKEFENILARSRETGGGDEALKQELALISKERDEFRERLKEFEIISDDLANLKRLHQENEQLKRSLAAVQLNTGLQNTGGENSNPISSPEVESTPENVISELNTPASVESVQATSSSLEEIVVEKNQSKEGASPLEVLPQDEKSDEPQKKSEKTPEDLLSEFEKMLG